MGAEALCRGASVVMGIERSIAACQIIEQNWQKVAGESQNFHLLRGDVVNLLANLVGQQFDRIYFDPPYAGELYQPVLQAIDRYELLAVSGELAVEHSPDQNISNLSIELPRLELCRHKTYGNTAISFYQPREGI
jgi:16S rRNA (guanine966-N2)-methyltransferase